jgi:hypothetical protein
LMSRSFVMKKTRKLSNTINHCQVEATRKYKTI